MSKIRKYQISMAVMTALSLIIGIASLINRYWISAFCGRICQFVYWGYTSIFGGRSTDPTDVYNAISSEELFRSINPIMTLEIVIMLVFTAAIAIPVSILIEWIAHKPYYHFVGLHRALFFVSGLNWCVLIGLIIIAIPNTNLGISLTATQFVVLLHIWFYVTLLLYRAIYNIYKVTGEYIDYKDEHNDIAETWEKCGYAWQVIVVVLFAFVTLGVGLILRAVISSSRNVIGD